MRRALQRLARPFRAVFGPMAHELWIYVAIPAAAMAGELLVKPGQPWMEYAAEFGHIFTVMICLGLPLHLTYTHLNDWFLPRHFQLWELGVHAVLIGVWVPIGTEIAIVSIIFFARPGVEIVPEHVEQFRRMMWIGGSLAVALMTGIFLSRARYRERISELKQREQDAQRATLRAQVSALQARIQPHFLFNCLNTVAGLIEEDPRKAEAAVERVSDLFRYTLDSSKEMLVPLEAELAVVNDYIELERLRYGERLLATLEVDAEAREVPVPPLALQPIVENAVLHGIADRRQGGRLVVEARVRDGGLLLSVEDDGPGPGHSSHSGSGTALADLRQRLAFLYEDSAWIREDTGPLGGFRVRIGLPLSPDAEPGAV